MIGATILSLYKEPIQLEPIIKKLRAPTKCPKVLICYDFHYGIFDEEEDLMFATKPKIFSIGTIVVPTSVWSNQPIKLITSASLNLIGQVIIPIKLMFKSFVSSNIFDKLIFILPIKITIPPNIFQHVPETFFQLKIKEMEID
jgi:hypothetical protein